MKHVELVSISGRRQRAIAYALEHRQAVRTCCASFSAETYAAVVLGATINVPHAAHDYGLVRLD